LQLAWIAAALALLGAIWMVKAAWGGPLAVAFALRRDVVLLTMQNRGAAGCRFPIPSFIQCEFVRGAGQPVTWGY